ncbi:hypothetical protein [Mycolicibacterium fortuitum]|uniref:hypothetical protein n=1 Tax=Mycolicibacterium fortuitum TaxID=1766 RepID=UPI0007E9EA85|nr:hypothetical protein [Mycolicibacterium fortuitum]OBG43011.1 hypothetical protein A5670_01255 [Mycolicibacterium fortuitum]
MTQHENTAPALRFFDTDSAEPVNLDPPAPALERWRELTDRGFEVRHDGDAEKILGGVHPRPVWADPDFDETGRSHLSTSYGSEPVRVISSHNFGVDHGDVWQPACAFVSAHLYGNSHESVTVTLSQVVDGDGGKSKWQNIGMSFQPHEALELAEVLRAAVDLFGAAK